MSMNKYMHPRNNYKTPPNFKQLAVDFPEFRPYVTQELTGKVVFDFKNKEALRALSCTLLKKDFGLDVELPLNKLIPTIPLRLNYILWLEDLLTLCENKNSLGFKGIDIGTGASCIYPLLAAKKNGWTMLATEVDNESFKCAKNNVSRNSLDKLIKIIEVDQNVVIQELVKDEQYDFCMCNPPFFGSTQELHPSLKSRKPDRPKPKNSFCASINEVVTKGGEIDFISKLISESKDLGKAVRIYTTMVGHKKSLPLLKSELRQVNVSSFKEVDFCQGNTTRWGLAWTFCDDLDLKKCPDPIKQLIQKSKPKQPLIYQVAVSQSTEEQFIAVSDNILHLLGNLKMSITEIVNRKGVSKYLIRAFANTWSNQRKKRRELNRAQSDSMNSSGEQNLSTSSSEDIEMNARSPGKREYEDCIDGNVLKKLKISETDSGTDFLNFNLTLKLENLKIGLELDSSVNSNRDYLHQILQYIKNHLEVQRVV